MSFRRNAVPLGLAIGFGIWNGWYVFGSQFRDQPKGIDHSNLPSDVPNEQHRTDQEPEKAASGSGSNKPEAETKR